MQTSSNLYTLITGCSTGIGFHAATTLKKRELAVIATCRKQEDVARLNELGIPCFQLDLASSDSIKSAVSQILKYSNNNIGILFNNGAFGLPGAIEDLSREAMRYQFETNVFGTQELTNLIIPIMRQLGGGKIIYNSSILGFAAMPYRGAYNASKFAIEGFADTLRLELARDNIQISLIQPGPITSNFRQNAYLQFKKWIQNKPSVHQDNYQAMVARLKTVGPAAPFTLEPEAVTKCLVHAINHTKIKSRYPVTLPTKVFAILKRILPTFALDYFLTKAGGEGKR